MVEPCGYPKVTKMNIGLSCTSNENEIKVDHGLKCNTENYTLIRKNIG